MCKDGKKQKFEKSVRKYIINKYIYNNIYKIIRYIKR